MPDQQARIGVLGIQGDYAQHMRALEDAGAAPFLVKTQESLAAAEGLIIPGGESSTVGMLLERFGLMEPLRERVKEGMPLFGTCTGIILMAREIEGSPQPRIGCMDISVRRNAYGRQVDSFESDLDCPPLGEEPVHAVFIRAPQVSAVQPGVEVLASAGGDPVLVRQGRMLGATFHPELTTDSRIHRLFVEMVEAAAQERK